MRLFDALSAMKTSGSGGSQIQKLSTVWSEQINPNNILQEYPRPQFRRDNWICLNGPWDYTFTKNKRRPDKPNGQILVPFSPETSLSGVGRQLKPGEYLWYFRYVYLASIPEGQRLILHFGAVDQRCAIWWNGKLVGKHQDGYLPFSFDITDFIQEGNNTLWVRVQDDSDHSSHCFGKQTLHPGGMFYTAQSGIWQTVWMEWVPENRIESLKITPLFDKSAVRLEITLTRPESMEIQMLWEKASFCHYVDKNDFPEGSCRLTHEIALPDFRPWSPEDPFLYELQILSGEDRVHSYFAMRKFSVGLDEKQRPRLLLNNNPYLFNGVLDQGYWPESLYTPPCDEAMIFDIRKMKELGFNMLRKHIKIEPLRWYYHCDRLGMVVWQDMVNGGGRPFMPFVCYLPTALPFVSSLIKDRMYPLFSRASKKGRELWEKSCVATVELLYNCPCIGLWVPFNEGWGQFDALRITSLIRHLDDTRLIDHASGWFDQGGGDVKSVHNYFRPLKVKRDRRKRPFVLSEYGGCTYAVKGHIHSDKSYGYRTCQSQEEFSKAFWTLQEKIKELEQKGLSAAVYTQLSDIEEEINGLYTYDRKVLKVLPKN